MSVPGVPCKEFYYILRSKCLQFTFWIVKLHSQYPVSLQNILCPLTNDNTIDSCINIWLTIYQAILCPPHQFADFVVILLMFGNRFHLPHGKRAPSSSGLHFHPFSPSLALRESIYFRRKVLIARDVRWSAKLKLLWFPVPIVPPCPVHSAAFSCYDSVGRGLTNRPLSTLVLKLGVSNSVLMAS